MRQIHYHNNIHRPFRVGFLIIMVFISTVSSVAEEREHPYYWDYSPLHHYIKIISLTVLKNSVYPDALTRFALFAERMPRLNLTGGFYNPLNYNLKDFDQFRKFLWSFYTYSPAFGFDFEDYYHSFTIDNFTDKFDLLDFFDKVTFYEEEIEIEAAIAQYWHEDDKTRWSYNPEWDISETFKMLSEDLLYMRDFIEDIRIFGTSIMLEGARRAADAVDPRIPVIEMPISDVTLYAGPTHEMAIFTTFRKARAEEFFSRYYGSEHPVSDSPMPAQATLPDHFNYIGDITITVTDYTGPGGSITIPVAINGKPVAAIRGRAFYHKNLTAIAIPNSITTIGNRAFAKNQLTSVTIPNSVIIIGEASFQANELTNVTIGNSLSSIGNFAFSSNQLTSVTIGNGVKTIGGGAFSSNQLSSVIIPGNVKIIGDGAFSLNQLTGISIPDSVTSIGNYAFYSNQLTSVTIGNSVTSIGDFAFSFNQLTSVVIPDSVKNIGDGVFCSNRLTNITIPGSVTSIGDEAFADNSLTSITIGENVWLGYMAFSNADENYNMLSNGFEEAYEAAGKAAGTYTRPNADSTNWTKR